MATEIKVNLVDNVDDFLNATEQQVKNALWAVGATAEGKAKANCPVDTGRLRNSITHIEDEDSTQIGTNVEYAAFVEEGTSKMGASHYLRRAITENINKYKDLIKQALGK